jgi:hypothetical protein
MRPSASIWCRVLWLACACGVLLPALSAGAHSVPRARPSASNATNLHDFHTPRDAERPHELNPPAGGRLENADADAESAERSVAFSPMAVLRGAKPAPSVGASIAELPERHTDAFHRFPLVFRFGPRPPPGPRHL